MVTQLTLPVHLHDEASFANFYPRRNEKLIAFLKKQNESYIYFWGHEGVGCTHLLQAVCQEFTEQGLSTIYLPLRELTSSSPQILENLETISLVCVDDVHCIAGKKDWEEAIFNLFNRLQLSGNRLLVTAKSVASQLNLQLPDLTSRLLSGLIFQVQELEDEDKIAALQLRAKWRGLTLSKETGEFLLSRIPRNFSILFNTLEKLDKASLAEQRKLTIPFIKSVLEI
jgi:DnaA family protein